jgi:hypothetical protein
MKLPEHKLYAKTVTDLLLQADLIIDEDQGDLMDYISSLGHAS